MGEQWPNRKSCPPNSATRLVADFLLRFRGPSTESLGEHLKMTIMIVNGEDSLAQMNNYFIWAASDGGAYSCGALVRRASLADEDNIDDDDDLFMRLALSWQAKHGCRPTSLAMLITRALGSAAQHHGPHRTPILFFSIRRQSLSTN